MSTNNGILDVIRLIFNDMNYNTFRSLSLFTPIFIALVLTFYFYKVISGESMNNFKFSEIALILIVAVAIGLLYNFLNLRSIITSYKRKMIELKIKRTVFNLYTDNVSEQQKQYLFKEDRLIDIFNNLISNVESLLKVEESKYFARFIAVLTADVGILGLLCSIAFFISIFFFPELQGELILNGFGISLMSIIAAAAHNMFFLKYIKLSNDQISYIENNMINSLDQMVSDALGNHRE